MRRLQCRMQVGAETYVLDPQARNLLEGLAAEPAISLSGTDLEGRRRAYRESRCASQVPPPAMAEVRNISAASLPARLYIPHVRGTPPGTCLPCLVYFHGGGLVLGDLDSHDSLCRALATQSQAALVSVAYRRAPEHSFPAAAEDAIAAVAWVRSAAGTLGIDGSRLAVGGDSAGGQLAAVAALAHRDLGTALALQLLVYPITDMVHDRPSHGLPEGYGLTREDLLWFRGNYLLEGSPPDDWRASPLRADSLSGLAPAYVITAGFDPLRDEGRAYAERLQASGVPVIHECFTGMIHGFLLMGAHLAAANHAINRAGQVLRNAFAGQGLQWARADAPRA